MVSEKELDKRAREFMTFPPKKDFTLIDDGKNKNKHNFGGFEQSRQEVRDGCSCY